jgi:succinate dehydrogenase / fumarate reductase cytochrome b subunit
MNIVGKFFSSSLGKKFVMAVSGCVPFLFVVGHMIGNLQIFLPPEAINRYARFLQSNLELLWPVRIVMLTLVVLHVWSAVQLSLENKAARPVGYADATPYAASYSSRTMLVTGSVVAAFIIYHLMHYTLRIDTVNGASVAFSALKDPQTGHNDVYAMIITGFSVKWVALFYLIGVGLLCFHLSHGIAAMFQSLGLKNHVYGPCIDKLAKVIALILFLGYASIPTAVMLGHGKDYLQKVAAHAAAGIPVKEAK